MTATLSTRPELAPNHRPPRERRRLPAGLGPQGGDPVRRVAIDLSTCVNRYGPAPAAVDALHSVAPADILMHPYDAADRLCRAYAAVLGVDPGELRASRAASEIIWAIGRSVDHGAVAVPLPAYTDYLRAFPGRGFGSATGLGHDLGQLDAALTAARLVIVSNPHNPTGSSIEPEALVDLARRHPRSVLVVDESYVEFTPDPDRASVVGCAPANVVVLRSASKFYGIAATRAGVVWCRDHGLLDRILGTQETWGLSGVDVTVAAAALASTSWAARTRAAMLDDSRWLADALQELPGMQVHPNDRVHFQYALGRRAMEWAELLRREGVGVRALGPAHGVRPAALRVVGPRHDERVQVGAALAAVARVVHGRAR